MLAADPRVHFVEVAAVAPEQQHGSAVPGAAQCHGTADALARSGHQDDAALQLIRTDGRQAWIK